MEVWVEKFIGFFIKPTHTHSCIAANVIYIWDPEGRRHFYFMYGTVNTNTRKPFNLDIYDIYTIAYIYNFIRLCFGAEEHTHKTYTTPGGGSSCKCKE